jgi:hypothetical protein
MGDNLSINLIRYSLEFINTKFREQIGVVNIPIMVRDSVNPNLIGANGDVSPSYLTVTNYNIVTKLNLFDINSLKDDITSISQSGNEGKDVLRTFLNIAKNTIDTFQILYSIKYKDGEQNDFYECLPVFHNDTWIEIDENKKMFAINNKRFFSGNYAGYNKYTYDMQEFITYANVFHDFVLDLIGDWIDIMEENKKKIKLEVKDLDKKIHFYKDQRWWLGLASGLITSSISLLGIYFAYKK